ncbi:MAG: hypothetical protein ABI867_36905 [Kofleriaceae bacterium]
MTPFDIPDDFRAFMKQVVAYLDEPNDDRFLDAEDALQDEVGYGGRTDGKDSYRFIYITADGHFKWELLLKEAAVRDIAIGLVIEIEGIRHDIVRTKQRALVGYPLLIWGEYGDDALHVHAPGELVTAFDTLCDSARVTPRMLRVWSAADDQLVAVVANELCALYVVESLDGYATSTGDQSRNDSFEVVDHDNNTFLVPYADCVTWDRARNALLQFIDHGNLGPEINVEGRIPSVLLMMGDVDRKTALAARAEPPREITRSSLPRMLTPIPDAIDAEGETTAPPGVRPGDSRPIEIEAPLGVEQLSAWARRLIELLYSRALIEIGKANLDEISYQLGGLLGAHATEAVHSIETAEWLANEIGAVRGVAKLFATGGDLQIALRRSREP